MVQLPLVQAGEPLAAEGQACPQVPQLFGSLAVLVHVPLHRGSLEGHPDTHEYPPPEPAEQTGVPASALHDVPHAPQLAVVVYWMHAP
jgi:hypothetical protein